MLTQPASGNNGYACPSLPESGLQNPLGMTASSRARRILDYGGALFVYEHRKFANGQPDIPRREAVPRSQPHYQQVVV